MLTFFYFILLCLQYFSNVVLKEPTQCQKLALLIWKWSGLYCVGAYHCLVHITGYSTVPTGRNAVINVQECFYTRTVDFCLLKWKGLYTLGSIFGLDNLVHLSRTSHMNYTQQAKQRALTCDKAS